MSLSTTANNDIHASHRNGFRSATGIHQKRSVEWPPETLYPWTTMCRERCWRPITSSIQNPNQSPNLIKEALIWDSLPQGPINKAVKSFTLWLKICTKADSEQFEHTKWLSSITHHSKIPLFEEEKNIVMFQWRCFGVFHRKRFSARENR